MKPELGLVPKHFSPGCDICPYAKDAKRAALVTEKLPEDIRMEADILCYLSTTGTGSEARITASVTHVQKVPRGRIVESAYDWIVPCPVAVTRLLARNS